MKRSVEVLPFEDKRNEDPELNGGLSPMVMLFRVESAGGRTEFELHTQWFPDDVHRSFMERGMFTFLRPFPKQVQQYRAGSDEPLVSDGAARESAERMFSLTLVAGGDCIWSGLEELHALRFGDDAYVEDFRPIGRFVPPAPLPEATQAPTPIPAAAPRKQLAPHVLLAAATIIMEAHAHGEN